MTPSDLPDGPPFDSPDDGPDSSPDSSPDEPGHPEEIYCRSDHWKAVEEVQGATVGSAREPDRRRQWSAGSSTTTTSPRTPRTASCTTRWPGRPTSPRTSPCRWRAPPASHGRRSRSRPAGSLPGI